MDLSLSKLKQFLSTQACPSSIAQTLNSLGLEVEEIRDNAQIYQNFVVAEIVAISKHPQADRLQVCQVCDGAQTRQIVCGASNARTGLKVVLAMVGAVVPAGGFTIKDSRIRGIESQGMLCSAEELNLVEQSVGIIELPSDVPVGSAFADYAKLNDVQFSISLTPNRGDCASVLGIARELAAAGVGQLVMPTVPKMPTVSDALPAIAIIDTTRCYQFTLTALTAVNTSKVVELVELSNQMMFAYGHPNHFYDADKVQGVVSVRAAKEGEKFTAIGGNEYLLSPEVLVIADEHKVLSIAGIIGGEDSKITNNSRNVLIEVAAFAPSAIADAGRILGIHTDARFRFERKVDLKFTPSFIEKLLASAQQLVGGQLSTTACQYGQQPTFVESIAFDHRLVESITGAAIDASVCRNILEKLGFVYQDSVVKVPSWRLGEITIAENLVEEVIRVYGYAHLPSIKLPHSSVNPPAMEQNSLIDLALRHRGFEEVISWTFGPKSDVATFGDSNLHLRNPINQELQVMRSSLLPNLLRFARFHINHSRPHFSLFEHGSVYGDMYHNQQGNRITAIRSGLFSHLSPHKEERLFDFFDIKADLLSAISACGIAGGACSIEPQAASYYHPGQSAQFTLNGKLIAYCGQIHPKLLAEWQITAPIFAFELFSDALPISQHQLLQPKYHNTLQPVLRDFAFVVPKGMLADQLVQQIKKIDPRIASINIFDVYQGAGLPAESKSVAISIALQPQNASLTDDEIDSFQNKVIKTIEKNPHCKLR